MKLSERLLGEAACWAGTSVLIMNNLLEEAEQARKLESENEELKSRLDEYIENERARMEEVDRD